MTTYKFDVTRLVNSPGEIMQMLAQAETRANYLHNERLADTTPVRERIRQANSVRDLIEGRYSYWSDGGGIVRQGGPRKFTSVVGVIWQTLVPTQIHVRVIGDRIPAPMGFPAPGVVNRWGHRLFGLQWLHPLAVVYPVLHVSNEDRIAWRRYPGSLDAIVREPWDGDAWSDLEAWAKGNLPPARMQRIALARVQADVLQRPLSSLSYPD